MAKIGTQIPKAKTWYSLPPACLKRVVDCDVMASRMPNVSEVNAYIFTRKKKEKKKS